MNKKLFLIVFVVILAGLFYFLKSGLPSRAQTSAPLASFDFENCTPPLCPDLTGNGFDGTLDTDATVVLDPDPARGNVLSVNAAYTNSRMAIDNAGTPGELRLLASPGNYSAAFWVKRTSQPTLSGSVMFDFGNLISGLLVNSDTGEASLIDMGGVTSLGFTIPLDTWTHIALTRQDHSPVGTDIGDTRVYKDGVLVATFHYGETSSIFPNSLFDVGCRTGGGTTCADTNRFTGKIDNFQIFSSALTPQEVVAEFTGCPAGANSDPDLISWWKGEDNTCDSENGNHGLLQNGATFVTGHDGQAFSLDGVDDYVNIDSSLASLRSNTTGTISLWMKPVDATPSALQTPISWGDTTGTNSALELRMESSGQLGALASTAGLEWYFNTDLSNLTADGAWTHVALVQNGTTPVLYVNGAQVPISHHGSVNESTWFNGIPLLDNGRIGDRDYGGSGNVNFFNGQIDDVRVYNRALSASEVAALATPPGNLLMGMEF